jgi:rubredoxin
MATKNFKHRHNRVKQREERKRRNEIAMLAVCPVCGAGRRRLCIDMRSKRRGYDETRKNVHGERVAAAEGLAPAPVTVRFECPICGGGHSRADHDPAKHDVPFDLEGEMDQALGRDAAWIRMNRVEEPEDFAQWLGRHCSIAKVEVPRAGTPRRRLLARVFAALEETGHDVPVLVRGLEVGEPERALTLAWAWITAELMNERGA